MHSLLLMFEPAESHLNVSDKGPLSISFTASGSVLDGRIADAPSSSRPEPRMTTAVAHMCAIVARAQRNAEVKHLIWPPSRERSCQEVDGGVDPRRRVAVADEKGMDDLGVAWIDPLRNHRRAEAGVLVVSGLPHATAAQRDDVFGTRWGRIVDCFVERVAGLALWQALRSIPTLASGARSPTASTSVPTDSVPSSGIAAWAPRAVARSRCPAILAPSTSPAPPKRLMRLLALGETMYVGGCVSLGLGRFKLV